VAYHLPARCPHVLRLLSLAGERLVRGDTEHPAALRRLTHRGSMVPGREPVLARLRSLNQRASFDQRDAPAIVFDEAERAILQWADDFFATDRYGASPARRVFPLAQTGWRDYHECHVDGLSAILDAAGELACEAAGAPVVEFRVYLDSCGGEVHLADGTVVARLIEVDPL
jgi:hypothetical protein